VSVRIKEGEKELGKKVGENLEKGSVLVEINPFIPGEKGGESYQEVKGTSAPDSERKRKESPRRLTSLLISR